MEGEEVGKGRGREGEKEDKEEKGRWMGEEDRRRRRGGGEEYIPR